MLSHSKGALFETLTQPKNGSTPSLTPPLVDCCFTSDFAKPLVPCPNHTWPRANHNWNHYFQAQTILYHTSEIASSTNKTLAHTFASPETFKTFIDCTLLLGNTLGNTLPWFNQCFRETATTTSKTKLATSLPHLKSLVPSPNHTLPHFRNH